MSDSRRLTESPALDFDDSWNARVSTLHRRLVLPQSALMEGKGSTELPTSACDAPRQAVFQELATRPAPVYGSSSVEDYAKYVVSFLLRGCVHRAYFMTEVVEQILESKLKPQGTSKARWNEYTDTDELHQVVCHVCSVLSSQMNDMAKEAAAEASTPFSAVDDSLREALETFVALGGHPNGSGEVNVDLVTHVLRKHFDVQLTGHAANVIDSGMAIGFTTFVSLLEGEPLVDDSEYRRKSDTQRKIFQRKRSKTPMHKFNTSKDNLYSDMQGSDTNDSAKRKYGFRGGKPTTPATDSLESSTLGKPEDTTLLLTYSEQEKRLQFVLKGIEEEDVTERSSPVLRRIADEERNQRRRREIQWKQFLRSETPHQRSAVTPQPYVCRPQSAPPTSVPRPQRTHATRHAGESPASTPIPTAATTTTTTASTVDALPKRPNTPAQLSDDMGAWTRSNHDDLYEREYEDALSRGATTGAAAGAACTIAKRMRGVRSSVSFIDSRNLCTTNAQQRYLWESSHSFYKRDFQQYHTLTSKRYD